MKLSSRIIINIVAICSLMHSVALFAEETIVHTPSGKIFSVTNNGDVIRQIFLKDDGTTAAQGPAIYNAAEHGNIVHILPYGEDGLVAYTSQRKIITKTDATEDFAVNHTRWDIKAMALIGDVLYILGPNGKLSQRDLKERKTRVLLEDGAWASVHNMISVGSHLVTVDDRGTMYRVDPNNPGSIHGPTSIGRNWKPKTEFLPLDRTTVVAVNADGLVQTKDIDTGKYVKWGQFQRGKSVGEGLILFQRNNIFIAAQDSLRFRNDPFAVNDVINHAMTRAADYNFVELKSEAGRGCILKTISDFVTGDIPSSIKREYPPAYEFNLGHGYTKSVIAHYCGKTMFKNETGK